MLFEVFCTILSSAFIFPVASSHAALCNVRADCCLHSPAGIIAGPISTASVRRLSTLRSFSTSSRALLVVQPEGGIGHPRVGLRVTLPFHDLRLLRCVQVAPSWKVFLAGPCGNGAIGRGTLKYCFLLGSYIPSVFCSSRPFWPVLSCWGCLGFLCFGKGLFRVEVATGRFNITLYRQRISAMCFSID